ncbi:hypothetical protein [Capybara microvirus Cap3_SP_554]|nr:hypothetical protein [Capybara microvirus Cap3_SP_554]
MILYEIEFNYYKSFHIEKVMVVSDSYDTINIGEFFVRSRLDNIVKFHPSLSVDMILDFVLSGSEPQDIKLLDELNNIVPLVIDQVYSIKRIGVVENVSISS